MSISYLAASVLRIAVALLAFGGAGAVATAQDKGQEPAAGYIDVEMVLIDAQGNVIEDGKIFTVDVFVNADGLWQAEDEDGDDDGDDDGDEGGFKRGFVPDLPVGGFKVRQDRVIRTVRGLRQSELDLRAVRTAVVPDRVLELVARLDAEDWNDREAAARALHADEASDEALLKVLDRETLTEEQRQRLMGVVTSRIRERERGAMGIRMSPIAGIAGAFIGGVEVTEVIEGLPAERVLKPGDIIVRIDERVIEQNADLIEHVQRMRPGQVIATKILRPHSVPEGVEGEPDWIDAGNGRWLEPIDVEFALGSYANLNENRRVVNPETQRRERLVGEIRAMWDRASVTLDGKGTIDGVVPPAKTPPPGTFRRLSP